MLINDSALYKCSLNNNNNNNNQELAERFYIGAGQTLRVHSPGGSTFLRYDRHIESVTLNRKSDCANRCLLLEEHYCQISSRSDLKRRSLRLFLKTVALTRTATTRVEIWVSSWSKRRN